MCNAAIDAVNEFGDETSLLVYTEHGRIEATRA